MRDTDVLKRVKIILFVILLEVETVTQPIANVLLAPRYLILFE